MTNYSTSKIYEIICRITNERYIGSTTQKLSHRLAGHRLKTSKCSSKQIIERGDYYINLIEEFSCQNKEQLLKKEREWYDKLDCINKLRPIRSNEEKVEYNKQYRAEHVEQAKQYRADHVEEIKQYRAEHVEQMKQYNSENAVEIAVKKKQYRAEHEEELRAYRQANKDRKNQLARERRARNKLAKLEQL